MKPSSGIVVDGSSRGNPGASRYKIVDIKTNTIIVDVDLGISTNNIAEFCGLTHAIYYALKNNISDIYCDSITAIAWARNKKANSKLVNNIETENSIKKMISCEKYLNTLSGGYINLVKKWDTKKWGENPADYGFK